MNKINNRIKKLRQEMKKHDIDCYIEHNVDPHMSEYVNERWKTREWISGFTGSVGAVVILKKKAALWADGRYFIQAENELSGSNIKLMKKGLNETPEIKDWIYEQLEEGDLIGLNGRTFSDEYVEKLHKKVKDKNIKIIEKYDLIEKIWKDRPEIPDNEIFIHELKYAGKKRDEKISEIREKMKKDNITNLIITQLDQIAWTLNIRGSDIKSVPVAISYLMIGKEDVIFYINQKKYNSKIKKILEDDGIIIKNYEEINDDLNNLKNESVVSYDKNTTNRWIVNSINKAATIKKIQSPILLLKSQKNNIEIENLEKCQIRDGVAMVKFLMWLEENILKEDISEIRAAKRLKKFRKEDDKFLETSFDTISAYKENAAMMHYHAAEETCSILKPKSFYLVDSGGQYMDGTTDITRTIPLGKLTEEEKMDYTLTLKSHINLASTKFLYGATGSNLDVLARKIMWEKGLDYKCGTGHGVGYLLSVHEGPQRISPKPNNVKMEEGMVTTIEPGVYKKDKHGIRIENTFITVKDKKLGSDQFMKFNVISYCPIDTTPLKIEMLNKEEKKWLNQYHEIVRKKLTPYLNDKQKKWLKKKSERI